MVGFFVEEFALREDEVGGEEDVGAEGGEEGVEGGGGGGVEDGQGTWKRVLVARFVNGTGRWIGRTVFSPRWGAGEGAGLG